MPKDNSEEEKTSNTDTSNEDGPEESKEKKSTETQFHDNEIHTSTTTLAVNYLRPEELEISGYPKVCDTRLCFNRLQAGRINLNLPPDNWLRSNPFENLDGFNAKNYLENKFSSLRMAYDFSNLEPPVDVITAAKNIKKLLKLAITSGDGLSMFVHPIGKHRFLSKVVEKSFPRIRGTCYLRFKYDHLSLAKEQVLRGYYVLRI